MSPASVRVVALNTWKGDGAYTRRLAAMATGLAALSPDIVALQESLAAPAVGYDTAAHLAAALGMTASTLPLRRKMRRVEERMVESTSGLAVLSRWPILTRRPVQLTSDPRDGERAALVVEIAAQGRTMMVACVHLTHLTDADDLRRRQWREVAAAIGEGAAIVAGDFNAPIDLFDLGERFVDARQACSEPPISTLVDDPSGACIDHAVLARDSELRATAWQTALGAPPADSDVVPSDHLAVVVDVLVESQAPTM